MIKSVSKRPLLAILTLAASFWTGSCLGAAAVPTVSNLPAIGGRISTPVRIAVDQQGNLLVSDPRAGGILKLSSSGRYLATIGAVKAPQGIALSAAGDIVVGEGSAVSILASDGTLKFQLGSGKGQFKMANGIAIDPAGNIYVADSLDNCVQVFSATGTPVNIAAAAPGKPTNSFGSFGTGNGQLSQPTGIAFERGSGRLAVADTLNGRIQFFGTDGTPGGWIGSKGLGSVKFGSPQGVTFSYTPTGTVMYVADTFQSNVQAIDLEGQNLLRVIGSYGTGNGKLVAPTDVAFDGFDSRNNRLLVANGFGNLTLFGIDNAAAANQTGGPALSIDTLPLVTNLTSLTLSGTVAQGATLKIVVSSSATIGAVTRTGADGWSATVTGLTAGNNIFTVTATDAAGKTSSATVNAFVIAAPAGTVITPLSVDALPSTTSAPLHTLRGTVQAGSTVRVNGNSASVTGGNWSYQATLTQGVNSFLIQASNPSFSDATTSISLTLDSVPPTLNLSMLPTGSSTSSRLLTISGTVADSSPTTVSILVNGQAAALTPASNGGFSAAVLLAPGANTIGVQAVDAAGNASSAVTSTLSFTPLGPSVGFTTPDGLTVSSGTLTLSGTASAGSSVTVGGAAATLSGSSWSATVPLAPGLNTVVATASLLGEVSSAKLSVTYDPALPSLAVTGPPNDALLLGGPGQRVVITGSAPPGVTLSASVDGIGVPVTIGSDGSFSLEFSVPAGSFGSHTVLITAVDAFGNATSSVRTVVVADPTPPVVTVLSSSPVKVSVGGGSTLVVRDKNGPVGSVTVTGRTSSIDLTGVAYDAATLNITAFSPAGSSSRNGVLVTTQTPGQSWSTGIPQLTDAVEGLKIAAGARQASFNEQLHGDVGPLVNGVPTPDGKIDIEDVMVIMMRIVGLW
jgi:sugar lactone lactonase YvrE